MLMKQVYLIKILLIMASQLGAFAIAHAGSIVIDGRDLSLGGTSANGVVVGSGRLAREVRDIKGFDVLIAASSVDVEVNLGHSLRLTVSGDDNLLPFVSVNNVNRALTVELKGGSYITAQTLHVTIESPSLKDVRLEGSGDIRLFNVSEKLLSLIIEGSGDIQAEGRVTTLQAEIRGSGELNLGDLKTQNSNVVISGAGDAEISVSRKLSVTIDGSGDVVYSGSPEKVELEISGAGEVTAD